MRLTTIAALLMCCTIPQAFADNDNSFVLHNAYDIGGESSQHAIAMIPGEPAFYKTTLGDSSLSFNYTSQYDEADDLNVVVDIIVTDDGQQTNYQTGLVFDDSATVTRHIGDALLQFEVDPKG